MSARTSLPITVTLVAGCAMATAFLLPAPAAWGADVCGALIRKDQQSTNRTVYLTGGQAWELLERYLSEAKKQGIDVSPWKMRVVISDGNERKQYSLGWFEMLTGQGARERWNGHLRTVTANTDGAGYQEAERQQWDIVCHGTSGKGSPGTVKQGDVPLAARQSLEGGIQFASHRDWNNAILQFTAAIREHPQYAAAYGNRGAAYIALRKLNLAQDDLTKGSELDATDALVHYNLTCLYALQNQLDRALVSLDSALTNGFHDYDALRTDPDLSSLRKSPEWRKTLEKHKVFLGAGS